MIDIASFIFGALAGGLIIGIIVYALDHTVEFDDEGHVKQ